MLQSYTYTGQTTINASGKFLLYQLSDIKSNINAGILVFVGGQSLGTIYPGDRLEIPSLAGGRNDWTLIPQDETARYTVMIGDGQVTPGTMPAAIETIDGSVRKSMDGNQVFSAYARTAAAGMFPFVGVFAETKSYALRRVRVAIGAASAGRVVGYVTSTVPPAPIGSRLAKNKLLGSAAEALRFYSGDCAAANGSGGEAGNIVTDIGGDYMQNFAAYELPISSPLILPAGRGLIFLAQSAAAVLSVTVDAEETF